MKRSIIMAITLISMMAVLLGACAPAATAVPPKAEPTLAVVVPEEPAKPEPTKVEPTAVPPTAAPTPRELDNVTVQLSWIQDAQFAGFFAADYLGYYEEEGIKVNFLAGGSGVDAHTMVRMNPEVIGIGSGGGVISAVSRGSPLVAVGAINQSHPNGFLILKDGPIKGFQDFEGHTIGVLPEGEYYLDAIIAVYGMDKSKMEVIRTGYDPTPLLTGQVDAIMAWIVNQPLAIEKAGKEWDFLLTRDVPGLRFYSTIPIVNKQLIEKNPDLIQRWVCASMKGWDYVLDNPEESAKMVTEVYLPGSDYEDALWFLQRANPLTVSDDTLQNGLGWMNPEVWSTGIATLFNYKQIEKSPVVEEIMTNQFIENCPIKR